MSNAADPGFNRAGSIDIVELKIISSSGIVADLKEFLVELNIYEDMFSNTLYGDILLSDSRNMIEFLPIIGEEYLNVHFQTPSFEQVGDFVKKSFRIYRLSNRSVVRDNNTQLYTLHFASPELFEDMLIPVYTSFEGNVGELAFDVYNKFLAKSRNLTLSSDETDLSLETDSTIFLVSETDNNIKFVSPGWTPLKIINWLASKAIPKEDTKARDFLFYETTKAFYFTSVEKMFKEASDDNNIVGVYSYSAANLKDDGDSDPNRQLTLVSNIELVESNDHIKNYTSGYLSNRLITLDVFNKKYELVDYDYIQDYKNYYHSSGKGETAVPLFDKDTPSIPYSSISFYPVNPKLFQTSQTDYFKDNISEKMKDIYGNRKCSLLGLTNVKLNITVPGRTDVEVGRMLYFKFPKLSPASEEDIAVDDNHLDSLYSGRYLITAVHHRITPSEHLMIMEIVKDSLTYLPIFDQKVTSGASGFGINDDLLKR